PVAAPGAVGLECGDTPGSPLPVPPAPAPSWRSRPWAAHTRGCVFLSSMESPDADAYGCVVPCRARPDPPPDRSAGRADDVACSPLLSCHVQDGGAAGDGHR